VEILFCGFFSHKKDCNAKPAACGTPKYLNTEILLILELSLKRLQIIKTHLLFAHYFQHKQAYTNHRFLSKLQPKSEERTYSQKKEKLSFPNHFSCNPILSSIFNKKVSNFIKTMSNAK
jgi:hypothetical protein